VGLSCWSEQNLEKRKNWDGCIYDPKDLFRSCDQLQIKEDNEFEEISEQKDYLLRNWGACVDTIFWKNRSKRGGRETYDEKRSIIGRLKKVQGSQ
jgi:hypothetical protein